VNISVIIPTLNEEGYIGNLIEALRHQTQPAYEILVVDCGSKDNTRRIVRSYPEIQLLTERNPVGNQRHVGGEKASGELLIFLDADTIPHRDFIASVISEMTSRKLTIACPHYVPYPGNIKSKAFYAFFNMLFSFSQYRYPSGAGSCICVYKNVFMLSGGFDKSLRFDDIAFIRHASTYGKFGFLHTCIPVSDRRIRTYGFVSTVFSYILLSALFSVGAYRLANHVPYTFGKFTPQKRKEV
jgi:glycosyltransferase involved in cell wall biosynthesis